MSTEIFRTPLVGTYVWNYKSEDQKIQRLYKLGKKMELEC